MKLRTGIFLPLSGMLLLGCSSLNGEHQAQLRPALRVAKNADAEYQRGRQLHVMGQYLEAQSAYLNALSIDPSHAEARNGMAALVAAHGDVDRAIGMLVELSKEHPASHVYANLGHAYQLKGNYFDARVALEEAVRLDPENQRTREKLKLVLSKLGATEAQEPQAPAEAPPTPALQVPSDGPQIVQLSSGVYELKPAVVGVVPSPVVVSRPAETSVLVPARSESSDAPPAAKFVDLAPAPASAPATQSAAVATVGTSRKAGIEIINGNGVAGLARSLRALVQASEWQVLRVANHPKFNVPMTRIEYAPGNRDAAQDLAKELQVSPVYRYNDTMGNRVRIVLGYDFRSVEPLRERAQTARLAALAD